MSQIIDLFVELRYFIIVFEFNFIHGDGIFINTNTIKIRSRFVVLSTILIFHTSVEETSIKLITDLVL